MNVYLTGDTHGRFERIACFCRDNHTTRGDVLIILGDAGVNYYLDHRDEKLKQYIDTMPVTLLCIHGNHEARPAAALGYEEAERFGARVMVQPEHPNLLFALDGEVYELAGRSCIAIGGAYSIDKEYRLLRGAAWWPDEQPNAEIKRRVERALASRGWQVDVVLSHTTPLSYEPTEAFLPFIDQSSVDTSTERWLDEIEHRLDYSRWYAGHFHTTKTVDKLRLMYQDYALLGE